MKNILLTDAKSTKDTRINQIVVTLQTTPINGDMHLLLKTNDGDEVALCSLKDIKQSFEPSQHFINQKVDFAVVLNKRIKNFCLPVGQQLILRVKGGILLKENILVCAQYI